MRFWISLACAATVTAGLAGCGGGGGGGGGAGFAPVNGGNGGSTSGSWLSFSPSTVDLSVFPNTSTPFAVTATSTRTIAEPINVAIIDSKGVITPNAKVTMASALSYVASMSTNPNLAPGTYTGNFEVRLCYDAPLTCARPVEGSPWQLPYKIRVIDPASLSYRQWEAAQTTPGFLDNFALAERNGQPVVVTAGFYTQVMETWVTADVGNSWTKVATNSPTPLRRFFALAGDGNAVYMTGGQTITAPAGQFQNDVWKFDGTTWVKAAAGVPYPARDKHVMAKVGSTLFVVGGRNAANTLLRDVWASYDDGIQWVQVSAALPVAVGVPTCALNWQNTLLVIGEKVATSSDGANWTVHPGTPSTFPRYSTQCAVMNGKLFVNSTDVTNISRDVASTADLVNWQIEPPLGFRSGYAPGMVAIGGRLVITTGQGSSQRTTFRTVP